jgi:hypothetical protein
VSFDSEDLTSMEPSGELIDFYRFIGDKLSKGETWLSPEETLDEWRMEHPDEEQAADDLQAIKEAVADFEAGDRGIPIDEFDRQFRAKHGLPPRE